MEDLRRGHRDNCKFWKERKRKEGRKWVNGKGVKGRTS